MFQLGFVTQASADDVQPLVELVLEARAEVVVNVTDVDSLVSQPQAIYQWLLLLLRADSTSVSIIVVYISWLHYEQS